MIYTYALKLGIPELDHYTELSTGEFTSETPRHEVEAEFLTWCRETLLKDGRRTYIEAYLYDPNKKLLLGVKMNK